MCGECEKVWRAFEAVLATMLYRNGFVSKELGFEHIYVLIAFTAKSKINTHLAHRTQ